jgi:hypothetical protein
MKGTTRRLYTLLTPLKLLQGRPKKQSALMSSDPQIETYLSTALAEVTLAEPSRIISTESLLNLPNELLEHICLELHPMDVITCRQVCVERVVTRLDQCTHWFIQLCRRFKELVDGSIELQLRIDLAVDGYLLGYRGDRPVKDVRDFHEKKRSALESMKYVTSWKERFSKRDLAQYDVRLSYIFEMSTLMLIRSVMAFLLKALGTDKMEVPLILSFIKN